MGSEVEEEEIIDEFNHDVENTVFVAVGKNVKESKSLILWSLEFFKDMKNLKICLLHIHQPPPLITLLVDRVSTSRLKEQVFKACRELEQKKMHNTLNQYSLILSQSGVHAGKVWIDGDNVEKGIVETISQYGIRWLVMGAAADDLYTKDMSELKSNKAIYVCQQAPISCHIWFACNGYLIHIRERWSKLRPRSRSISALSPSLAPEEEMLTRHHEAGADMDTRNNVDTFENSTSTENVLSTSNLTRSLTLPAIETSLTLCHTLDADGSREKPTEPPAMYLEGPKRISSSDLHDKLDYAKTDAENTKQKAFEQSIKRWRAEEDAKEALDKAEVSENLLMEEVTKRKEKEALLATQTQEIETMKNQRVQFMKELEIIKHQKPELIDRISEARAAEKELEEKIIQAVNLLITFKKRRDNLQEECDNARRQISRLSKPVNEEDTKFSHAQFYKPTFMEIMEATQDFNQSLKIGEGRYGSVYKGILRHVRIAIKMLPSIGSQGDAEFEDEAEVLSRIRHPNIVTLIGVCPESRSLVYEYLENGSLENRITSRGRTPPLQWHSRIQIASDICSALMFIHSSKPPITHGNLNFNNILLDSNNVSKISDLGINRFIPDSEKLSVTSDVYSFGVVLLRILTGRPASGVVNDVKYALKNGNFGTVLDMSAGDWPIEHVKDLAYLGLRCCEKDPVNRRDLVDDVLTKLETMKNLFLVSPVESENQRRIPSYFVCPIFQEVMKDPYIAADGFTYEEDAIKGWINSGHKTSPMTNLKLDHCDLLPNHALTYAIQEWQQHS